MAFERFPYTNFHDLNLDWILEKIKEIETFFNNLNVEKELKEEIEKHFNDIMVESTYDEDNEMIILSSNITATGDTHVYADKTMIIK